MLMALDIKPLSEAMKQVILCVAMTGRHQDFLPEAISNPIMN
jgi:hypothetical protein